MMRLALVSLSRTALGIIALSRPEIYYKRSYVYCFIRDYAHLNLDFD
jgi:hypothetical protein